MDYETFKNLCRKQHLRYSFNIDIFKKDEKLHNLTLYLQENLNIRWFIFSCINGYIETAKWLYDLIDIEHDDIFSDIFNCLCCKQIEICKWINTIHPINICDKLDSFVDCCCENNLEMAEWIYDSCEIKRDDIIVGNELTEKLEEKHIESIITMSDLSVIKWLDTKMPNLVSENCIKKVINDRINSIEDFEWFYEVKKLEITDSLFKTICLEGNIRIAKWMYEKNHSLSVDKEILINSCKNNFIKMLKWFWEIKADLHFNNDELFIISCEGDFSITNWLLNEVGNIDVYELFKFNCKNANIKNAKILYEFVKNSKTKFEKFNENTIHDLFILCCKEWTVETAQLLYSLEKIDLLKNNDEAFKLCWINKKFGIAEWICSLCNRYTIKTIKEKKKYKIDSYKIEYDIENRLFYIDKKLLQ